MLVTNKNDKPTDLYLDFIIKCAESGITSVQLREKKLSFGEVVTFGRKLQKVLAPYKIPLIINDDVNLAYELNADGLHLGQSDGNAMDARQILGVDKIIGLTINSTEQLSASAVLPIDYVGIGAIFKTKNKVDAPIWECAGLKRVSPLSRHPIVAIGGIDETNAAHVMSSGADGIAAIGAFEDVDDPILATKNLRKIVEEKYNE